MRLRSRHRLRLAFVVLLSLLFQQTALAAYACDMDAMTVPRAEHCAGMDEAPPPDNPALCAKHCSPDRSTLVEHLALTVPAILVPSARFAPVLVSLDDNVAWRDVAVMRSDPPPRLRYCTLLI